MYTEFKINKELEDTILGSIPKGYFGIKKAVYVYVKLCRTLNYSMDYFVGKKEAIEYFTNPANIEKVDGKGNKDVVCYVFNAILLSLYDKLDLIDDIHDRGYRLTEDRKRFEDKHYGIEALVAGVWSLFDGTNGRIKDNDLTALKYSNRKPTGWKMYHKNIVEYFNQVLDQVIEENPLEPTQSEEYLIKLAEKFSGKQNEYPIEERIEMFLKSISIADYQLFGFNNLIEMNNILFTEEERTYNQKDSNQNNIYFKIVKVKDTQELKALLFCKIFDKSKKIYNLDVYEMSLLSYKYTNVSVNEIINRIDKNYYVRKHGETLEYPEVIQEVIQREMI